MYLVIAIAMAIAIAIAITTTIIIQTEKHISDGEEGRKEGRKDRQIEDR